MDVLQPMGWFVFVYISSDIESDNYNRTSENVSRDFGITRLRMDELALASNLRAANAQDKGFFDKEIMPMYAYQTVAGSSERQRLVLISLLPALLDYYSFESLCRVLVTKDNGPRAASTAEGLEKVRPAFGGTTTGGNASQLTDGIAGVLLMKRSKANELGLQILGRSVTCVTAGLAPRIMGIVSLCSVHESKRILILENRDHPLQFQNF